MIRKLAVVAVVVLVAILSLLAVAASRPDAFEVARRTTIQAPPERVHGLIVDLEAFNRWNPWLAKEPATTVTYGASTRGRGASFAWSGDKTGAGSMTVTAVETPGQVDFDLVFERPMSARNVALFRLRQDGAGTEVTWTMRGPANLMTKLMDLVVGMDRMVGPDFEAGLAALKTLAERPPARP